MGGLETAIAFAAVMHKGQVDKGGQPYILHPLRVMGKVTGDQERIAAVLHDVVEDCDVPLTKIADLFGTDIADAVEALTRRKGEAYADFIDRICGNVIARRVKIADLRDNMDLERLGREPTIEDVRRQWKYGEALNVLLNVEVAQ